MKIEDKRVTFPKSLSVKYAGKIVEETETHLTLEGEDEDSYLKIFTPFRGVAKLVLYENDRWVDADISQGNTKFYDSVRLSARYRDRRSRLSV